MAKLLSRDEILGIADLDRRTVEVPEWKGRVVVAEMSAAARVSLEESVLAGDAGPLNLRQYQLQVLLRCVVGEDGTPLFTEADLDELAKKSPRALGRVFQAALEVNGLAPERPAAGDEPAQPSSIEAARGNSEAAPGSGSSSSLL